MSNESQNQDKITLDKEFNLADDFTPPTYEEWKAAAEQYLKGVPFEKALNTPTYEGIDLKPIYTKEDINDLPHLAEMPGFGNYIRGASAPGYLAKSWDIRQDIFCATAQDYNKALKHDLERGQTAINLTLDQAAASGKDADTATSGETANEGLSISNLDDLCAALKDIELEKTPIHINAGAASMELLMFLNAFLKKQGKTLANVKGSISNDPIGYAAQKGSYPRSMKQAYDNMAAMLRFRAQNAPHLNVITVSGLPYHNSGASAVQELAFVMATAVEYIREMTQRGLAIGDITAGMSLTLGIGPFTFMEISKIRAARVLWAKIIDAFGGDGEAKKITIHGVTSQFNQTIYDPYVNMLRTTTEAFSGVVGGVDSLQTNPFDQLFGQPDEFSRRIARNTQLILKEESHLDQLIDPAGGSYFVESLTHQVAEKTWAIFQEVQHKEGMLKALEAGYPQAEVVEVNLQRNKELVKRKKVIVGTNNFANVGEEKIKSKAPDFDALFKQRVEELTAYRKSISAEQQEKIEKSLKDISAGKDMIAAGTEAVLAGATLGGLFAVNQSETDVSVNPMPLHRQAEMFEELRDAAAAYEAKTGAKPKLFLATMGPVSQFKARADFTRGFFEVGGFDVLYPAGFDTPEAAVEAAVESGAQAAVICSTDPTYPELVPPFVNGFKGKKPEAVVILAGYPKEQLEAHKEAGVDEFIFMGADVHKIISNLFAKIGVTK